MIWQGNEGKLRERRDEAELGTIVAVLISGGVVGAAAEAAPGVIASETAAQLIASTRIGTLVISNPAVAEQIFLFGAERSSRSWRQEESRNTSIRFPPRRGPPTSYSRFFILRERRDEAELEEN